VDGSAVVMIGTTADLDIEALTKRLADACGAYPLPRSVEG
jgi:uncharacterized membrane protein YgcG